MPFVASVPVSGKGSVFLFEAKVNVGSVSFFYIPLGTSSCTQGSYLSFVLFLRNGTRIAEPSFDRNDNCDRSPVIRIE